MSKKPTYEELEIEIQALKKVEEALKKREEEYRATLDNLLAGVVVQDASDTSVVFSNPEAQKIFDMTSEELSELKATDHPLRVVHEDLTVMKFENYPISQAISTKKAIQNYIIGIERPNGKDITWINANAVPLFTEDGEVDKIITNFVDITALKQVEENLKKARNYIFSIINSMPSVLVGVNPDGMVAQWNSEAERVTGVVVEDAVGQPLKQAFPRLAGEMDRVRESIRTREVRFSPKQARQENNETLYEDITVYPLVYNGVEGAVIRIDNVTERVRLEEMMIQSEKMLSVGGLAAGMAHEINNPMAGMMQTANVVINRLTNKEMPANRRAAEAAGTTMEAISAFMEARGIPQMLTTIDESGRRVAEIITNMLSFARKGDAETAHHDMAELLDKTLELASTDYDLKKRYDFRAIEIIKAYEENLPPVPCEGAKIQQVILNIFRNGAQAMQDHCEDEKHRFTLRLAKEADAKMIVIEIEDNGPGMDEATRRRVFEPFFTTKPLGVGTGLGLSVSYFIVTENHNGTMDVKSKPGEGTVFIIRLPLER